MAARKLFSDPEMRESFDKFIWLLYPEHVEEHENLLQAAFANIDSFRDDETRTNLQRVLDHLLDGEFDDDDLERAWRSTSPSYGLHPSGAHRIFLDACREYLKTGKYDLSGVT